MKHFILFLIIAMVLSMNPLRCLAGQVDDFEIFVGESEEAVISTYYGNEVNLIIPSSFADPYDYYFDDECEETHFPLGWIGDEAFIYNTDLKTVVIPEGITGLGYRAFYGCENLETVVLPSTIDTIYDEAFAYCTNLTQINLPNELFYVGENIFTGCSALKLTQEEKDVLVYTEVAAHIAQQEAFVVDTENLIELSGYLGTDFYDFVDMIGDMEDSSGSDGIEYSNGDVSISGTWSYYNDEDVFIEYISLDQKSNYSLMGVYVSMDSKNAMKILLKAGWKLTDKGNAMNSFEDPNGNWLSYWFDENNVINDVCIFMSTDIIEAVYDGGRNYDFSKLFVYDDPKSDTKNDTYTDEYTAKPSSAYTTGNVSLRTGPGLDYDSTGSIPVGVYMEYLGESSIDERGVAWYYVCYNGRIGWSSSKYVELQ